jgi:uncharacterized protein
MKTLHEIESILRDQKPILRQRFKVKEIGIFGSFVRGEQKDTSDLDLQNYAEEFIKYMTFNKFANYKNTVLSVTKCIEIVGEATKHIPSSVRERYTEIPWQEADPEAALLIALEEDCKGGGWRLCAVQ